MPASATSIPRLAFALLAGLVFPGAGHLVYGRRDKAVYFAFLLLLAFCVGLWLGEGRVIHAEKYPLYLLAQGWLGLPCFLALLSTSALRTTHDIAYLDAGLLFTSVAGLLNVVVLVDLYEIHLKRAGRVPAPAEARA